MKWMLSICISLLIAFFSVNAMAGTKVINNRQLGGACGVDRMNDIEANCASDLTCKSGTCEMKSFLSGATVSCKDAMAKNGAKYVAVHDGFCYIDSECKSMYNAAMRASSATSKLLMGGSTSSLAPQELDAFNQAKSICDSCGKNCVMGASYLGRGGY